jgi:hypothetical protein
MAGLAPQPSLASCSRWSLENDDAVQPGVADGRGPRRSRRNIYTTWGSEPSPGLDHLDRASPLNATVVGQTGDAATRKVLEDA